MTTSIRWPILLIDLLTACSTQSVASPTPSVGSCRLAVIEGSKGQGGGTQQPGFLTLPGGTFAAATDAGGGMYYDAPRKRWVPWGPPVLSPDGSHYVSVEGDHKTSRVFLTDVRSGTRLVLSAGGPWQVVGMNSNAAFAMRVEYVDTTAYGTIAVSQGLWRMPLDGTAPTQLTRDDLRWQWVDERAVYGAGSTADVSGYVAPLVAYEFSTGKVTVRFDSPGRTTVLGTDATGGIFVMTEAQDEELWRVPATPGYAVKLWSGSLDAVRPWGPAAVDGPEVWLSSASPVPQWVIYRYTSQSGLRQVAVFTDRPVTVAGGCAAH